MIGMIIGLAIIIVILYFAFPSFFVAGTILTIVIALLYIQWNYCYTTIDEGTSKDVMRAGVFHKSILRWQDHMYKIEVDGPQTRQEDNWDIVEHKTPRRRFGGLVRFTNYPYLDKIDRFRNIWAHVHFDGKIAYHDEFQSSNLHKVDIYAFEIRLPTDESLVVNLKEAEEQSEGGGDDKGAEDIDGVPLGIAVGLPMWEYNPYISKFIVRRWYPMIRNVVIARLRLFTARHKYREQLLPMRAENGGQLWEEFWQLLKQDFMNRGAREDGDDIRIYGWKIMKQGAGLVRLDPAESYRRLTTLKYEAERNREVTITNARAQGQATIILAIAKAKAAHKSAEQRAIEAGLMYGKIVTILTSDKFGLRPLKAQELAADFTKYWKGTEEKAITDWRFSGADGSILAEIAKIVGVGTTSKQVVDEKAKQKSG